MKQILDTHFTERAQHQQRRVNTALEESLQHQLRLAYATGTHLDLEVFVTTGFKFHMRVQAVDDGLLTGLMLHGFRFHSPRECAGPAAIRISRVMMIEWIIDRGSQT